LGTLGKFQANTWGIGVEIGQIPFKEEFTKFPEFTTFHLVGQVGLGSHCGEVHCGIY